MVESPAAFAPSICPGAADSYCWYSMEVPKDWGAGFLTAVKLWESHRHPSNRVTITNQMCVSTLQQNSICKGGEASSIQFSNSCCHWGCWQMCTLTVVQKPSQRTQEAEIPFLHQLVGFAHLESLYECFTFNYFFLEHENTPVRKYF